MNNMLIMFDNAGLLFCYERYNGKYSVVNGNTGKEEVSTYDALGAWSYYIQRVDSIVRRRISESDRKRIGVQDEKQKNELLEDNLEED